ncbi:MAG: hypothetical protein QGG64_10790 [Candidatus Latescibacteria bacterium]|jgi:hypothetical protein|nr:hypothetical protein [Candidatus Latescibacterota bacterium]
MNSAFFKLLSVALWVTLQGCTTYANFSGDYRSSLRTRNYEDALAKIEKSKKKSNSLLYMLENGLLNHYQGHYALSNRYFAEAERLSDQLFTRSISTEAAALIINDAIRNYRGDSFEMIAVHYYRALNYWYLGLPEDALVECRKANLKLNRYAIHNGQTSYKNDAFIHYITGLFYEATGELNDARISYLHTQDAYAQYKEAFNFTPPNRVKEDLQRVDSILNGGEPDMRLASLNVMPFLQPVGDGELVIFSEIGFIPRKVQEEIDLPIYENDIKRSKGVKVTAVATEISHRHHLVRPIGDVEYWLRVALPKYETVTPRTKSIRIRAEDRTIQTQPAQTYAAIAKASLQDHYPGIMVKTIARGFAKYMTYRQAKKENKILGFFTNLLNVSTEIADTRSWVSLPHNIHIGRMALSPGIHTITLEALDTNGNIIETETFTNIEINPGQRTFLNHRVYQ